MTIHVENRQRGVPVDLSWLRRFAAVALQKCTPLPADGSPPLRTLDEIEVAIVSDRLIARVHRDFMGLPGPTDVITFEHGEIVMSAETAQRHAREYGHSTEEELALYIIHGLLHLNGHEDRTARGAARMRRMQQRVLFACLTLVPLA